MHISVDSYAHHFEATSWFNIILQKTAVGNYSEYMSLFPFRLLMIAHFGITVSYGASSINNRL